MVTRALTVVICATLAVIAFAAPAQATTLVLADGTVGPQPYQSWVDRANVPTIPGTVTLRLGGCADLPGCVPDGELAIDLAPDWANAHVLLHELGHLFDDQMPSWARTEFMDLAGGRSWLLGPASSGEQFAEAYSLCARKRTIRRRSVEGYRYSPSPADHQQACALIRRAGAELAIPATSG
jgi:hypothetical protein